MAEMTIRQFEAVATALRSKEPAKTAARMILVEEKSYQEVMQATGMSSQAVSNALRRFRAMHAMLLAAYS